MSSDTTCISVWIVIVSVAVAFFLLFVLDRRRSRRASRTVEAQPKPRKSATPLPARADPSYRGATPVQTAQKPAPAATNAGARPPQRIVHCPRCRQSILNDAALIDTRVVCPVCNCKFFFPREV